MKISVLTACLPQRKAMLAEAVASVQAQVCPGIDVEHLIGIDHQGEGAGPVLNRRLADAKGDWVMVLDDDDLLLPEHLATVVPLAEEHDVVYSMPRVEGGMFTNYHEPFDPAVLARKNIVSHTALMRAELVRQVGGWNPVRWFDWDLFRRLEAAGAEFLQVPETTWVYRLHGANWSQGTLEGAPA